MPSKAEWLVVFVLPLQLTLLAWYMLSSSSSKTDHHQDTSSYYYFKLWCFYFLLDAAYGYLFHTLLLVPARWIARQLPGAVMPPPNDEKKLVEQEESSDDVTLEWPSANAIANLPLDWVIESVSILGDAYRKRSPLPSLTTESRDGSLAASVYQLPFTTPLNQTQQPGLSVRISQQPYSATTATTNLPSTLVVS